MFLNSYHHRPAGALGNRGAMGKFDPRHHGCGHRCLSRYQLPAARRPPAEAVAVAGVWFLMVETWAS